MCFRLNGICCGTKCVNFNKSTLALARTQTSQRNETNETSTHIRRKFLPATNASGIFSFAPTHFSVIVASPPGLILMHVLPVLSACVCPCVCFGIFFASYHLAHCSLIVHHSNKHKSGLRVFHVF